MNIKTFKGFEDIYPEKIEGTDSWYYGQGTSCSEACEVPEFNGEYPGTKLYLIEYPSGNVFEPLKQEKNVFLERPVYDGQDNSFGIIRYDFNKAVIQVIVFKQEYASVKVLTELPLIKGNDLINLRLVTSPLTLVKHEVHSNAVDILWPKEMYMELEENEELCFQLDNKMYMSKWMEDPDYHEEFIIREAKTGQILERVCGYLRRMPDGSIWKMTK